MHGLPGTTIFSGENRTRQSSVSDAERLFHSSTGIAGFLCINPYPPPQCEDAHTAQTSGQSYRACPTLFRVLLVGVADPAPVHG